MTVAALNAIAAASIAAVSGVADANIAAVNGEPWPAGGSSTLWSTTDLTPGGGVWTLANGDTRATEATSSDAGIRATAGTGGSGKWYWELVVNVASGSSFNMVAGVRLSTEDITTVFTTGKTLVWRSTSAIFTGTTSAVANNPPDPPTYAAGDILMFAYDRDNNRFYIGKNGTWANGSDPTDHTAGSGPKWVSIEAGNWMPYVAVNNNSTNHQIDLVNGTDIAFTYSVPTGYAAI